jgi:hypothetical protein
MSVDAAGVVLAGVLLAGVVLLAAAEAGAVTTAGLAVALDSLGFVVTTGAAAPAVEAGAIGAPL